MNENDSTNPEPIPGHDSDSLNVIDVVIDGPGDHTVRPLTGKRRELALAERERLRPWLELLMQQHEQGEPNVDKDGVE